ncbi:tryptamine 5-hydroxylase-like [Triticum dicoccoides]|uniref:tryptamine 5-hydroxylase-like n=1 Tax=Triticum dicoccoides TaxID=85692 RepID=UPI000E79D649|nr:tryptamine 5-hydroxylase-like [Triticum dicoccoides]
MELNFASYVSIVLLVLSGTYVYCATRSRSPLRLPPSPPGWPVIGHLHLMTDMPHHALAELARSMRAPLLRLQLGSIPAVVISKPDLAREALTTNDAAMASRPHLLSGQFLSFGCSDVTFAPAGAYHRMVRRVVVSDLVSPRRVATYGSFRDEELRRLLAHLTESASTTETSVNLSKCLLNLANDVLCRIAFGRRFPHGKDDKLAAVLAESQDLYAGFAIGDFFPELEPLASTLTGLRRRLKSCLADLREVCDEIIEEHISGQRQRIPGDRDEDFVDVLLRAQKAADLKVPLTDDNLKSIVLDIFIAGTDTTFATIEWTMTELMRHPRILRKAQDEVRWVVGAKGQVEESDLVELHYMRAIIKETFRLHPVVPLLVPRESIVACTLGGYDIPAKTRIFINTFALGRDPEIWEDPLEYWPERFEIAGGEIDLKDRDYKLMPFGGGRRGCPGYTFALPTVQLTLAKLMYHFEWALPEGVRAEDISVEESFGLATKKKEPLFVAVRKSDMYEFKGE